MRNTAMSTNETTCIIRVGNKETNLPYQKISTLKRKVHAQTKWLGLRSDTHWKTSNDSTYYHREYYDSANNPVIATICYI